jgi:UDP-N-acetylglucosamine 2-epimerase
VRIVAVTDGTGDEPAAPLIRALEEGVEVRRTTLEREPGSELSQTAAALSSLEPVLADLRPAAVLVHGDGVAALAAALLGSRLEMPLIRIGAGVRSGDADDPAEINRTVADRVCDLLLCEDRERLDTLGREGLGERARMVGDPAGDPGPATEAILAWLRAC